MSSLLKPASVPTADPMRAKPYRVAIVGAASLRGKEVAEVLNDRNFPAVDIKLLDDDNNEVRIGEPGEVCAKGPQVMRGYWQKPEANADAFTADGYFRTGDIGVFDAKGFLKIVDRKKDMIIVSGFNVFPNEVEAVAAACSGVAECACIGRPDEKTGEAVRLFVAKARGVSLTEADLIAHCRRELSAYKVPKEVRFLDALPKSNVGKILRKDLRGLP